MSTLLSSYIYIYSYGIDNTLVAQSSIHIPVQQGGKSSWNRPTDPYIKVDFDWFQSYKTCQPSYHHIYMYIFMGRTSHFWGKIPFTSQFSKVASLAGIGPQIHKSKLTVTGSNHKKHGNTDIVIYPYILMGLASILWGISTFTSQFSKVAILPGIVPHIHIL
jgi:hypothetical protein